MRRMLPLRWMTGRLLLVGVVAGGLGCSNPSTPTSTTTTTTTKPSCTFSISPTSSTVAPTGGSVSVTITLSPSGCSPDSWTASSSSPGVNLSTMSGSGAGTVLISVLSNSSTTSRTVTATVAGQTVSIGQAAALLACSVTYTAVAPDSAGGKSWNLTQNGGTRQVQVTVTPDSADCASGWNAASDAFIDVSPRTGKRSALVTLTVAPNTTGAARTGTVGFASDSCSPFCGPERSENTFTIAQQTSPPPPPASCTYSLTSPKQVTFGTSGGTGVITFSLASGSGCTWTAGTADSFITVQDISGTGDIRVRYTVAAGAGRTGIIQVRWPGPQVGENIIVVQ
jgi:hypothetical protein